MNIQDSKITPMYDSLRVRVRPKKVGFFGKIEWPDLEEVRQDIQIVYGVSRSMYAEKHGLPYPSPEPLNEKIVNEALKRYARALYKIDTIRVNRREMTDGKGVFLQIDIDFRVDFERFGISVSYVKYQNYLVDPKIVYSLCLTPESLNESFYEERKKFSEESQKISEEIIWEYFKKSPNRLVEVNLVYEGEKQKTTLTEEKFNDLLKRLGHTITKDGERHWTNGSSFTLEAEYKTENN